MKIHKNFIVTGMDCADCALHVEEAVKKIDGVADVKINLMSGNLQVCVPQQNFDESNIINAIRRAGYDVSGQKRISSSFSVSLVDDKHATHIKDKLIKYNEIEEVSIDITSGEIKIIHSATPEQLQQIFDSLKIPVRIRKSIPDEDRLMLFATIISGMLTLLGSIIFYTMQESIIYVPMFALAILLGGLPIAKRGLKEALSMRLGMNFLMSAAIIGAAILGEWHEAAMVVFLFVLAQFLESRTMEKARRSIGSLMDQRPRTAELKNNSAFETIAVEKIKIGQILGVRPGESIPVDGTVVVGFSAIDQSSITGESVPVDVKEGDQVFAGTLNTNGFLEIRADRHYDESTFAKILDLVAEAQSQKSRHQTFVERFSLYYTPIVILAALLIAVILPLSGMLSWSESVYRALVLLIISCPCAFVISTPVTVISGLTNAMRSGILVKGGRFLEQFARLRAIAFDKTGTLTHGRLNIEKIIPLNGMSAKSLLKISAALSSKSTHPISEAITTYARQRQLKIDQAEYFRVLEGRGITGIIDNIEYFLGNHRLFEEKGWCDQAIHQRLEKIEDASHTAVLVGNKSGICGIIGISDQIRSAAKSTTENLRELGFKRIHMLTGDNLHSAKAIAQVTGIRSYDAELLPQDKVATLSDLKKEFGEVAMVGDGINDAPALAAASLGVAMGVRGSDAALETADIALMSDDLSKLVHLRRISVKTLRIIKENIFIALFLKFTFLLLAIPGLATLWMAVFADMGASLIVIFNGLRVLTLKPQ
jgi:Cd2+/Zn2+-exporting ATPase